MTNLKYDLVQLTKRNRDGSFQTQHDRLSILSLIADQLHAFGWRQMRAQDIKGRHVNKLVASWKQDGVQHATIRNRLAVLRWWCARVGRRGVMPPTNDVYQLEPRHTIARESKAHVLPAGVLPRVQDRHVQLSLALQAQFGLRRAESLLIKPWQADHGHELVLQGSWTKGGRPRRIPIVTQDQRRVLDEAKALVRPPASLIPVEKTYREQLHTYTYNVAKVGLSKLHGLRHAYAQRRFADLAGFPCPACGGPAMRALTPTQRQADSDARMILAEEMGHSREQITTAYIGR
jgi:hypothetical protein